MKNKHTISTRGLLLAFLFAFSLQVVAQKKTLPPNQPPPPPVSTFKVLGAKPAVGKVVKGAPYSATATTETVQTLSDGNQIIRNHEMKLYRDSEGRTRTEQTLETIGKWATNRKAQQIIIIHDPVTGVSYSLDADARIAHKIVTPPQKTGDPTNQANGKPVKMPTPAGTDRIVAKGGESLGTQTMEGVAVEGVRVVRTIPAGEIGNVKLLEIVEETWYAPELQIVILRKNRDPRSGEIVYRLTNVSRHEPAAALFEVPTDYTITVISDKIPPPSKSPKEEE